MVDIQSLIDTISDVSLRERSNYHATFGDLIDKLKAADDSARISPLIVGVGAYRGYYSDIALCTQSTGISAYKVPYDYNDESVDYEKWYKESAVDLEFPQTPKELAAVLESLLGVYFDGYKGGYNQITREKPLWIAADYGDCSGVAVIEITDSLNLITKVIE